MMIFKVARDTFSMLLNTLAKLGTKRTVTYCFFLHSLLVSNSISFMFISTIKIILLYNRRKRSYILYITLKLAKIISIKLTYGHSILLVN